MTDLFEFAASHRHRQNYRNGDPGTSCAAGVSAINFSNEHCERIYTAMRLAGRPLAAKEVADILGWPTHHPVNRRFSELVDAGLIAAVDGDLFTNPSGRKAQRYRVIA